MINIKKSEGLSPKLERLNNKLKHYLKRLTWLKDQWISWIFVYWFTAAFFSCFKNVLSSVISSKKKIVSLKNSSDHLMHSLEKTKFVEFMV